jgi:hypothetical protein
VTGQNLQCQSANPSISTNIETPGAAPEQPTTPAGELKAETVMAGLRAEQNLGLAVVGGLAAAVVGAAVWAAVTLVTGLQIGWMAIGVGFLVGGAVRLIGKGVTKPFGYVGAAMSLLGCLLGNLLSLCAIVAQQEGVSLSLVLLNLNPLAIPAAMMATFHPMDLLFYAMAVSAGYRFSFRRVTSADVARITTELLIV